MPIHLACPHCGQDYTVKDDAAGRRFRCKNCGDAVDVPGVPHAAEPEEDAESHGFDAAQDWDLGGDAPKGETGEPSRRRRRRAGSRGDESSGLGKASLILGCIVWVLAVVGFIIVMGIGFTFAQQMEENGGQPPDESQFAVFGFLGLGICGVGCLSYVLSIIGGVLGLIDFSRPDSAKGQAIGGVILNGLYFIGMTGLVVFSMILGNQ